MTPNPAVLLSTVTFEENGGASILDLVLTVRQAQRIVVVVGSGILDDLGYQDLCSDKSLYGEFSPCALGQTVYQKQYSTSEFLRRIVVMKQTADAATPSRTHQMIAALNAQGLLQRCYTQDIGGLEARMLPSFPPAYGMMNTYAEPEERCILMHGSLGLVWCSQCLNVMPWLPEHTASFDSGLLYRCTCEKQKCTPSGFLMPLVANYGSDNHPYKDAVQRAVRNDSVSQLDLVMVMGTSQQLDGVWKIIPHLANGVSTVIFVNKDPPPPALSGHFTHHVQGNQDDWANMILNGWDYEDSHHDDAELRSMTVSEILEGRPVTPRIIGGALITKDTLGWSPAEAWDLWLWGNEMERRKAWQYQEIYRMIVNRTGSAF